MYLFLEWKIDNLLCAHYLITFAELLQANFILWKLTNDSPLLHPNLNHRNPFKLKKCKYMMMSKTFALSGTSWCCPTPRPPTQTHLIGEVPWSLKLEDSFPICDPPDVFSAIQCMKISHKEFSSRNGVSKKMRILCKSGNRNRESDCSFRFKYTQQGLVIISILP